MTSEDVSLIMKVAAGIIGLALVPVIAVVVTVWKSVAEEKNDELNRKD